MALTFDTITNNLNDTKLKLIIKKIFDNQRLSFHEGLYLYLHAGLPLLGTLAHFIKGKRHGKKVSFIKNIHLEVTNRCINKCAFCSFRSQSEHDVYELSVEDIFNIVDHHASRGINEIHIVGGIDPEKGLDFWMPVIQKMKVLYPAIHIKAFTAAELDFIFKKSDVSIDDGLRLLKKSGLDSIPGGGAEIFVETIRQKLFPDKISSQRWLEIHQKAHLADIPSNATMLYGHIETIQDRVTHMEVLRDLQDSTKGFNAFIPLKFKNKGNALKNVNESPLYEDLKVFAMARIFLDNIPHIKAYWPMLGKENAMMTTNFGADDIDGTINNTTQIYARAGAADSKPQMNPSEMKCLIESYRGIAIERDALYKKI